LSPAKGRAVSKHTLCRPLLKAVGKEFFTDCPIILTDGKEKQSAKTSFADCLAGGKENLVAKVTAWQVAKKTWWQRWRHTNGAHRRPLCHLPGRHAVGKDEFFYF